MVSITVWAGRIRGKSPALAGPWDGAGGEPRTFDAARNIITSTLSLDQGIGSSLATLPNGSVDTVGVAASGFIL